MTEDEQLQAAIKASLEDTTNSDIPKQNGDSDEFVSLSSGEDGEAVDSDVIEDAYSKEMNLSTGTRNKPSGTHFTPSKKSSNASDMHKSNRNLHSRKRKSSDDEGSGVCAAKMPRSSTFQVSEGTLEQHHLYTPPKKGHINNPCKGKERAALKCSLEEQLQSGELCISEVSKVVVRLPDGTRVQKDFLSNSPVKVYNFM